jgi:tetratricopeptide (TPR) repeat protein
LAGTYGSLGLIGVLPPKEARQKQEEAVLKALEIDNDLAEAHAVMAYIREMDLNWSASEEENKRALELNPNSVSAHVNYTHYLMPWGRFDEAMVHLKLAQQIDPLSLSIGADIGRVLYFSRQYDRAIEQFQKTIELDATFVPAHTRLGWVYLAKRMYQEAITEQKTAIALDKRSRKAAWLGYAYAVAGKRDEALKILDELKELAKQGYVSPYESALIYMGLGDKDQAFVWLGRQYEERPDVLNYLKVDPVYDSLRSDARFTDLVRRMKLAP